MNIVHSILAFLLSLNLVVSASGIPVVVHSCGGVIESIHVFATSARCDDSDVGCDDSEDGCAEEGCCTNTVSIQQWHFDATPQSVSTVPIIDIALIVVPFLLPHSTPLIEENTNLLENSQQAAERPPPLLMSMRC